MLPQKPRLLRLVERLGFAVSIFPPGFKGSAPFFLAGDDGRNFRLLGGSGFSAEAARFSASLPACGAGVSFSGFGGKGAAMISTASSSM